jgi:hypothetical protein
MRTSLPRRQQRSRGTAAVEFAILLVAIIPLLLAGVLFYGRFLWHYTIAEKAAHDAARFMAAASPAEFKTAGPGGGVAIVAAARALATRELAELRPGTYPPEVGIFCDWTGCYLNRPVPQTVTVEIVMTVQDPLLGPIFALFNDGREPGIPINATATSHVGN